LEAIFLEDDAADVPQVDDGAVLLGWSIVETATFVVPDQLDAAVVTAECGI
jgi:hypothetical protein